MAPAAAVGRAAARAVLAGARPARAGPRLSLARPRAGFASGGARGTGVLLAFGALTALTGTGVAAEGEAAPAAGRSEVLLATTTSVRDSGLLEELVPVFRERTGIRVRYIAVGSGAALRMGAEGNADLLLTHAPEGERELFASGAVVSRRPFMENHFVIAGPPADPAKVADAPSAVEAFRRIHGSKAPYVSRGDDSGTHRREKALLEAAGLDPAGGWDGFARTGAGMAITLQVAGERRAYTLSDIGTYLAFRERIGLAALSTPEPALRNVYSVLRVSSERFPRVRAEAARALADFLTGSAARERIAGFGRERFGRPLFRPLAPAPGPGAGGPEASGRAGAGSEPVAPRPADPDE